MPELSKIGYILYNGVPVLYSTSVEKDEESGDNAVRTNVLGLAGHSDGAEMANLSVSNAVPQNGYEYNWAAIMRSHTTIDLGFKIAGKTTTIRGRLLTVKVGSAPDKPNNVDFTFQGRVIAES